MKRYNLNPAESPVPIEPSLLRSIPFTLIGDPVYGVFETTNFPCRAEIDFALMCNRCGIGWLHEPFDLHGHGLNYRPDFWLPSLNYLIEVKDPYKWGTEYRRLQNVIWWAWSHGMKFNFALVNSVRFVPTVLAVSTKDSAESYDEAMKLIVPCETPVDHWFYSLEQDLAA